MFTLSFQPFSYYCYLSPLLTCHFLPFLSFLFPLHSSVSSFPLYFIGDTQSLLCLLFFRSLCPLQPLLLLHSCNFSPPLPLAFPVILGIAALLLTHECLPPSSSTCFPRSWPIWGNLPFFFPLFSWNSSVSAPLSPSQVKSVAWPWRSGAQFARPWFRKAFWCGEESCRKDVRRPHVRMGHRWRVLHPRKGWVKEWTRAEGQQKGW